MKYEVTYTIAAVVEADDPDEAGFQVGEMIESSFGGGGPWPIEVNCLIEEVK